MRLFSSLCFNRKYNLKFVKNSIGLFYFRFITATTFCVLIVAWIVCTILDKRAENDEMRSRFITKYNQEFYCFLDKMSCWDQYVKSSRFLRQVQCTKTSAYSLVIEWFYSTCLLFSSGTTCPLPIKLFKRMHL